MALCCCTTAPGQESTGSKTTAGGSKNESKFPANGVRFVICSPTGERVPTPLYAKVKNEYLPIRITSRMPSPRLAPSKGKVAFYTDPPSTKKAEKSAEPYMEVAIPSDCQHKSICVVVPGKDGAENKTFFMNESEFAKGGTYIVNFTNVPLEMVTSLSGKFDTDAKRGVMEPKTGSSKRISKDDANVWSYTAKKARQQVHFMLNAKPTKDTNVRIKASVFMPDSGITQMNFVVAHPRLKNTYKLMSIQYSDVKAEDTAPPGEIPPQQ